MDNARLFEQAQWVQTELKRSNEDLRRANQDLETFAYSASHDLNEPLRTIALSAELLERTCADRLEDDGAKFVALVLQGVRRMESLIQDLLAYTTATKYEEGLPPGVDAGKVLTSVLENLKGQLEQAGAVVTQTPLPVVAMHESRLAQILQNLVGNGIKYRGAESPGCISPPARATVGACCRSLTTGLVSSLSSQIRSLDFSSDSTLATSFREAESGWLSASALWSGMAGVYGWKNRLPDEGRRLVSLSRRACNRCELT